VVDNDWKLLRLRPAGMFSNVNEVVQQLYLAEREGYRFVIDWTNSCYADPAEVRDPWEYYFEQPFSGCDQDATDLPLLPGGQPVACAKHNIITPREIDGECAPLLLPTDRVLPHRIISRYLRLQPRVTELVESFAGMNDMDDFIGLHIRGAGRIHGGVPRLREHLPKNRGVPLSTYFSQVDAAMDELRCEKLFVASDSEFVISECRARYQDRIICFPSQRSDFGEMHVAGKPENRGLSFDKPGLGLEVLVEALLLAKSRLFVHGNSNLVNFVLCFNAALKHRDVYA
jgi:hypothetical protein